ncbi:MAG: hypothetical protein PHQ23_07545, partial [Candidatus Wallbacteria bacterium]|nr:hypothetical protein [Candidatus Wallbacteria bacterium]
GICSDTGFFRNENVTTRTLDAVRGLLAYSVELSQIVNIMENSRKICQLQLLALGINRMKDMGNGLFVTDFPYQEWSKLSDKITDIWSSGIFYQVKSLHKCELGIYFMEKEPGEVLVEFRCKNIDCSIIAVAFGGGGHARASGCTMRISMEEAVTVVCRKAQEELVKQKAGDNG